MLIDVDDFEKLPAKQVVRVDGRGYACIEYMGFVSRIVMGTNDKAVIVDHINHDILDNRKCNLRLATKGQNNTNRLKSPKQNSSRYKGVHWDNTHKYFKAQIRKDKKQICLGYFKNEAEAALAYDDACVVMHGEFALPNYALAAPLLGGK